MEEENATPSPGSQKTASVATSGSPPIDSSGISGTINLRAAEVIDQAPEKSFWQKAGGFVREHIIDNIPVVGGLVKAVEAIIEGDWKGAAMGFGEALLDGVLLVTTGGIGNIAKVGAKTAIKIIAKETLENYVSGKVSDGLSDVGISPLGQVALGVVLGINPGKGKKPTFDADDLGDVSKNNLKRFSKNVLPDVSLEEQLAGKGQLRNLRNNPNLKGVDIDVLLKKTPAEIEEMYKGVDGGNKIIKQINKAFEGRDLGRGH